MSLVPLEHSDAASRLAGVRLCSASWDELHGWREDDHHAALVTLGRTASHVATNGPHKTGALGISGEAMVPILARSFGTLDRLKTTERRSDRQVEARRFFEQEFTPYRIARVEGGTDTGSACGLGGPDGEGFVTGFYEPFLQASRTANDEYRFPIHGLPPDLVKVGTHKNGPHGYDWAILDGNGALLEVPDRAAIESATIGTNAPVALFADWPVIAWARDRVDLFFAHVQGAARLTFPDGSTERITFAAKSGHPFTGIGGELVRMGELPPDGVSMDTIRAWLARHPARVEALLQRNRSYIFFRTACVDDPSLGPVAAARVPLAPNRSLAVDRLLHTFGTPIHVHASDLADPDAGSEFARLMIAQETGTAIRGAARGDIFTGSGAAAGRIAGRIANAARFTVLVPQRLEVKGSKVLRPEG